MAFLVIAVTLDMDIAILGIQNLSFCRLGAILAARGHLGGPWEQQEGQVGVQNQVFMIFEMILGLHFEVLLGSDGLSSICFFGLVFWPTLVFWPNLDS